MIMEKTKRDFDSNLRDLGIDEFEELPRVTAKLVSLDKEKHLLLFSIGDALINQDAGKTITISTGTVEVLVKTSVHTVYDISEDDKEVYLLAAGISDNLVVRSVFSSDVYNDYFSDAPVTTIDWFFKQNDEYRQKLIKRQVYSPKFPLAKLETKGEMTLEDYKALFNVLRSTFDENQQKHLNSLFNDAKTMNSDLRSQALRKIDIMLNSSTAFDPSLLKVKPSQLKKAIKKDFYGQDVAVDAVCDAIIASAYSNEPPVFGFFGPPGTGKTYLCKVLARVLGKNFTENTLENITHQSELSGTESSFHQSKEGSLIAEKRKLGNEDSIVMLFNELDKALSSSENGNIKNLFASIISERKITDSFVSSYVYCSNDFLFFTGNDLENIPSHLRSRMQVIVFDSYTVNDKIAIVKNHIIPNLLKKYHLSTNEVLFKDNVIKYIFEEFTIDAGIRKSKEYIEAIFNKILTKFAEEEKRKPVIVSKEFVDSILESRVDKTSAAYIYHRNRKFYPKDISLKIEKNLALLEGTDLEQEKRLLLEKELSVLVKIYYKPAEEKTFNPEIFYESLKDYIGRKDLKQMLIEEGISDNFTKTNSPTKRVKIFVGGPGLGKTHIAQCYARAKNIQHLAKVPCGNIKDKSDLQGLEKSYREPHEGLILKEISCACDQLILLDEFDKVGYTREGNYIGDCLLDLFDINEIYCPLIDKKVKLSNVDIIITANDISKIPQPILDRCSIFNFEAYRPSERETIFEKSILPKLAKPFGIKIETSPEVVHLISNVYNTTTSVRKLEESGRKIIKKALFNTSPDKPNKIVVDKDLVIEALGPIPNHHISDKTMLSGCSIGLGVSGNGSGGSAFKIESTFIEDGKEDLIVTGLAKDTVKESAQICISLLKKKYPDEFKNRSIHIHFTPAAVPKEGPSAGISIYSSLLSLLTDTSIHGYAFTGEISLSGILPVGGLQEKATAALRAGCHTMFVPKEHDLCNDFVEEMTNLGLKIKPISHVDELDYIFEET